MTQTLKVKRLSKAHLRATERHLPYGITQCLPATGHGLTSPAQSPTRQTGTRFTDPEGMGSVDFGVGYIPRWFTYLRTVTRSSTITT